MADAVGIHAHPDFKLGVRPADPSALARMLAFRLALPAHPATADHLGLITRWMLGGNDRFGTCGPAAIANLVVLLWKYLLGEDITVTDDAVFALYRASGNPTFDPTTGAGDAGVDMTVMLDALMKVGIDITHAGGQVENVKPIVYGKIPLTTADDIRASVSLFGAAVLAADLETAQQAQTDAGLWDYQASPVWGGHAFIAGRYTSSAAVHTADITDVTWAVLVGATDSFISHEVQEGYAVIFGPLYDHPAFQAGVDLAALKADFLAVTGRVLPDPAPPVPVPPAPVPPVPPTPPPPAPEPNSNTAADDAFAAMLMAERHGREWVDSYHGFGATAETARAARVWLTARGYQP